MTDAPFIRTADHVAFAVTDLGAACHLYGDVMGGQLIAGGDDPRLGVRTVQYLFPPGVKIELLSPLHDECYLKAFIRRHGEGFHHMTYYVDDVAAAVRRLEAGGYEVVDTDVSRPWWHETFVRPLSGFGALIQLAKPDPPTGPSRDGLSVQDIMTGRVIWHQAQPRYRDETDDGRAAGADA